MTVQYLIDSENVGDFWIPLLELPAEKTKLVVFYTRNSPHMSYESLIRLKQSDREVEFIKCYEGTNALDFQLVSELGYRICADEEGKFVVVTNDTGYDAAVKYWRRNHKSVRRITGKECKNLERRMREDLLDLPAGQRNAAAMHRHLTPSDHREDGQEESLLQDPVVREAEAGRPQDGAETRSSRPSLRDLERAMQPEEEDVVPENLYEDEDLCEEDFAEEADDFADDRETEVPGEDLPGESCAYDDMYGMEPEEETEWADPASDADETAFFPENTVFMEAVSENDLSESATAEEPAADGKDRDGQLPDGTGEAAGAAFTAEPDAGTRPDPREALSAAEANVRETLSAGNTDEPETVFEAKSDVPDASYAPAADIRDGVSMPEISEFTDEPEENREETDPGDMFAGALPDLDRPETAGDSRVEAETAGTGMPGDDGSGNLTDQSVSEDTAAEEIQEEETAAAGHRSRSRRSRSRRTRSGVKKQETAQPQTGEAPEQDNVPDNVPDTGTDGRTGGRARKGGRTKEEAPHFENAAGPSDEEIRKIAACIGAENLAELHNQLATFYGDHGKEIYLSIRNGSRTLPSMDLDLETKFQYYCEIIFANSDEDEMPEDLPAYLLSVREKLNSLNSLRYALQKHFGKEKGRRYYFVLKPYAKTMYQM